MNRLALISPLALAACASAGPTAEDLVPDYLGIETTSLANDLVQFKVSMSTVLSGRDLQDYADCAVSEYAVFRQFDYARHLRTKVYKEGGAYAADAVYTISPTKPDGLAIIDANAKMAECKAAGIPTV